MDIRPLQIRNRSSDDVLFEAEAASIEDLAVSAIEGGAYLGYARLPGLKLPGHELKAARLRESLLADSDFSRADLSEAQLSFADLSGCNLSGLVARGADFSGANLTGANLCAADIMGSNLRGANLMGANLSRANLGNVDLTGADLTDADLTNCNLHGADLSGALMSRTDVRGSGGVIRNPAAEERRERTLRIDTFLDKTPVVILCQIFFLFVQCVALFSPWWVRLLLWLGATVFSASRWDRNMNNLWLYGAMVQFIFYWLDFIPKLIVLLLLPSN